MMQIDIISLIFGNFGQMETVVELSEYIDQFKESILVMRQQTEQMLPAHQHEKGQFLLVFGGIAYLQTLEKDYYIPANHYIWIPKRFSHNLMFNTQDLKILNIYFPEEDLNPFYDELGIYPVSNMLFGMLSFTEKWTGNYFPGSWEFEFLTTLKKVLPRENLKKFTIQLPITDDVRLNEITEGLRYKLNEPISLEEVALKHGFSVRTLTRLFQNKLHISFLQYLKMLRIIRAMELLKDSDISISNIAYEVGYSDISSFSNTFVQLTNMRPSEFRSLL